MKIFDGLSKRLLIFLLKRVLKTKNLEEISINQECEIKSERFKEAYYQIKKMMEEIEKGAGDKIHIYILDIFESEKGRLYCIDDCNNSRYCGFYNDLFSQLYKILCKNPYRIDNKSIYLSVKNDGEIETIVKELIENINIQLDISNDGNDKKIRYYQFSQIVAKHIENSENIQFLRVYGIGLDVDDEQQIEENKCKSKVYDIMLEECIGYIENPIEKKVLDTFRITEEYASTILADNKISINAKLITEISTARYETEECKGTIIFQEKRKNSLISFERVEINQSNIRIIRKFLEMSRNKYSLLAEKDRNIYYIYGMEEKKKDLEEGEICLKFEGYKKWNMKKEKDNVFLERDGDKYKIIDIKNIDKQIDEALDRFPIENKEKKNLKEIIEKAKGQSHGTMIILIKAGEECDNLVNYFCNKKRGIKLIRKIDLIEQKELIISITAIDGAVIINSDGECCAIGVIIDGIAKDSNECDMARGARYNSALTFITNINFKNIYGVEPQNCKIFIFSEDKTLNILPDEKNKKRIGF